LETNIKITVNCSSRVKRLRIGKPAAKPLSISDGGEGSTTRCLWVITNDLRYSLNPLLWAILKYLEREGIIEVHDID
jgi:hypothetical protein